MQYANGGGVRVDAILAGRFHGEHRRALLAAFSPDSESGSVADALVARTTGRSALDYDKLGLTQQRRRDLSFRLVRYSPK